MHNRTAFENIKKTFLRIFGISINTFLCHCPGGTPQAEGLCLPVPPRSPAASAASSASPIRQALLPPPRPVWARPLLLPPAPLPLLPQQMMTTTCMRRRTGQQLDNKARST